ncbi:nucleoside hydrolase [Nakamurella sp. YIM 132087]|uniref:Nucleoside hydrolase n=2 Tax=Nakamurella alba TaxID=2665158 RepID=A0A7K1FWW0_9ACTN|nr:nucleoside hydrolase [Nakamurella alba]
MAIGVMLADPGVDTVAITTTFGNVDVQQAAQNTLELLALAGRPDVPVAAGATHPIGREFDGGAPQVHGGNGIGGISLPAASRPLEPTAAAETIVRLAREHQGRLHIVATGPLSNLAAALELDPELPGLVEHVTVMGGAAAAPGNVSPVAEANIWNDPIAAAAVFAAAWPMTMVGLDVTMRHLFTEPDREALLAAPGAVPRAIGEMLDVYFAFYEPILGFRGSALHDPLAMAIATGAVTMALAPTVRVEIDATEGPGRGQTIVDLRGKYSGYPEQSGAHCRVALQMADPFAPVLRETLLRLP